MPESGYISVPGAELYYSVAGTGDPFLIPEPDGIALKPAPPPAIDRLREITVPVLLISGALDLEEKNVLARRLVREIPHARHLFLPAAHMVSLEQAQAFNEAVLSFLRGPV